ncbi:MAG: RDD family protein, partial [Chloroflexi bacterium]|nr:RDD family protein [Chloroflexota bacterium]
MAGNAGRLAQIFIWKQGAAPDLNYARQVLGAVNSDAASALSTDAPPLRLFSITGAWPDDPWSRALLDMRAIPAPEGTSWADTSRYDLAGWQGTDSRTGDHIFIVTAYRRATPPPVSSDTFQGTSVSAPPQPPPIVSHMPYYPQYPTGPVGWPPPPQTGQSPLHGAVIYGGDYSSHSYNPSAVGSQALPSGPETATAGQAPPDIDGGAAIPDSYAPFYVNFFTRLKAALIDFAVMALFQVGTVAGLLWAGSRNEPRDLWSWLGVYGPFICLALFIFVAYHVVQWSVWGQTVGKRLMRIKVVRADGGTPEFGRALARMLGYFFSFAPLGAGFVMIALYPRRQGLHDKIAETYVVPEKPALPAPAGLPGYKLLTPIRAETGHTRDAAIPSSYTGEALGMAAVASPQQYEVLKIDAAPKVTSPHLDEDSTLDNIGEDSEARDHHTETITSPVLQRREDLQSGYLVDSLPELPTGPVTEIIGTHSLRDSAERFPNIEKARTLFRSALLEMEKGVTRSARGYKVDAGAARAAAAIFSEMLELVPDSLLYRYFYAVALRYSEGFEVALREFRQVLESNPSHYEARQQVAYGQRWHDAFAYPSWGTPAPVSIGDALPDAMIALLPPGREAVTHTAILREGGNKVLSILSRTPSRSWTRPPTLEMPASIDMVLSRTPSGPIITLYVIVHDDPQDPYIGETFLNPHDPGLQSDDACQLGQHIMEQLAKQDHTYLIFVDDDNKLLLSRKLVFDANTQVNITRVLYEVQTLP